MKFYYLLLSLIVLFSSSEVLADKPIDKLSSSKLDVRISEFDIFEAQSVSSENALALANEFRQLTKEHDIVTLGVASIKSGRLAWSGYFGEQSPNIPASSTTQFNVGSITKVVAAETILRLVDKKVLSLDEPMSTHWVDPDIANDSSHKLLTPRMSLTHTTGFPNWRFFTQDQKLSFEKQPGLAFSYSGEGFEYLAKFVEKKTGSDFASLVREYVFNPIGISNASYYIDEANFKNIAQSKDADGNFPGHYCYPFNGYCRKKGSSTPADDLVINVEDFTKFLVSVMRGNGYSSELIDERNTVQSSPEEGKKTVDCNDIAPHKCPNQQGYGLGWEVLDYGNSKIVAHGGSDWHELSLAYFDTQTLDGIVIFINAPNKKAVAAMPLAISLLDSDSPYIQFYQRWLSALN